MIRWWNNKHKEQISEQDNETDSLNSSPKASPNPDPKSNYLQSLTLINYSVRIIQIQAGHKNGIATKWDWEPEKRENK